MEHLPAQLAYLLRHRQAQRNTGALRRAIPAPTSLMLDSSLLLQLSVGGIDSHKWFGEAPLGG